MSFSVSSVPLCFNPLLQPAKQRVVNKRVHRRGSMTELQPFEVFPVNLEKIGQKSLCN